MSESKKTNKKPAKQPLSEEEKKAREKAKKAREQEAKKNAEKILVQMGASLGDSTAEQPMDLEDLEKKQKNRLVGSFLFVVISIIYVVLYAVLRGVLPQDNRVYETIYGEGNDVAKIFLAAFLVFVILGITSLLRSIVILSTSKRSARIITLGKLGASAIKYTGWSVLVFVLLNAIFAVDTATLFASAGILALVLGLGAQTLIADIIGGLEIVFEDQFAVGDVVVIDEFRGTVREIGLSFVKLIDAANNIKVIRNNQIATVINLSRRKSVAVCDCSVDYDSDMDRVREIILSSYPDMLKKIPLIIGTPNYLGVQELAGSAVNIRLVASCKEEDKFAVTRALNEYILKLLKDNGIKIPFPQVEVSNRK